MTTPKSKLNSKDLAALAGTITALAALTASTPHLILQSLVGVLWTKEEAHDLQAAFGVTCEDLVGAMAGMPSGAGKAVSSRSRTQCYCGKLLSRNPRFRWCTDCLSRNQSKLDALFLACQGQHDKRGGGAAMCICGAGGGGSSACAGLSLLKSAITGSEDLRREVVELAGWRY